MPNRTIEVGDRQGRGNPPAFYTKGHRVSCLKKLPSPNGTWWSAAFWTITSLAVVAACALILILYFPKEAL
jgi:hypothetical protein